MSYDSAFNTLVALESGGDPNATNPNSTAQGLLQFTAPTWAGVMSNYPALGLTPDGRTDPAQNKAAFTALAQNEYAPALASVGITNPKDSDYATVHTLGVPAAKALYTADPSAPASRVLGKQWNNIYSANPSLFGHSPDITASQALSAVDSRVNTGGPSAPAPSSVSEAMAQPQASIMLDDPAANTPDVVAPPQAPASLPAKPSKLDNLLTYLAAWGSGANGQDFAAGLGRGAANGLAALQQVQDQQNQAKSLLTQQAQQGFENTLAADRANEGHKNALSERGKRLGDLLTKGVSPASALALATGRGRVDPASIMRLRSGAMPVSSYENPTAYVMPNASGGYDNIQGMVDKRTGQPTFRNLNTGDVSGSLPNGAVPSSALDIDGIAKQSTKDRADYDTALTTSQDAADNAAQLDGLLGKIPAGPGVQNAIARGIANVTGQDYDGTDAQALQLANKRISQMGLSAIHMLPGRTDLPMVRQALKSVASLQDTSPQNLYYLSQVTQSRNDYLHGVADTWDNLPATAKAGRTFASFRNSYEHNKATQWTPPQPQDVYADFSQRFAGQRNAPAAAPQGSAPVPAGSQVNTQGQAGPSAVDPTGSMTPSTFTGQTPGGHSFTFTPSQ